MLKPVDLIALLLVVVGALNWGLVGLFEFDLVATIVGEEFGETNAISRIIYILVALSGLYLLSLIPRFQTREGRRRETDVRAPA
ncbi:MAG TPA: DUF378 domain-containing protein [Thermomicrobiales bacterium]|nr:DUF378 domain-containing protein [Thermomicrobiales bacterium]